MKTTVFIAISLDGFIARENGDIDWLPVSADPGEDYGYADLMADVDALVMGRNTFEKVLSFGQWPYGEKPIIVLSHRPLVLTGLPPTVEVLSASPRELVEQLTGRGLRHIYVDGGQTVQGFLRAGLVDELILTTIPVLLGRGLPLFGPLEQDVRLRHQETHTYPSGLVQSRYLVEK